MGIIALLPHGHPHSPTINVEGRSGYVGSIAADQEGNRRGHLFRPRTAFHNARRDWSRFQLFFACFWVRMLPIVHLRYDPAWRHSINPDPIVDELIGHRLGGRNNGGLDSVINPLSRTA